MTTPKPMRTWPNADSLITHCAEVERENELLKEQVERMQPVALAECPRCRHRYGIEFVQDEP